MTAPKTVKEEKNLEVKPFIKAEKPAAKVTIKKEGSDIKEEKPASVKTYVHLLFLGMHWG